MQQSTATSQPTDEVRQRVAHGLAMGRLNYDLHDYHEALMHLTDVNAVVQGYRSIDNWADARSVKYYLYKSYVMAPERIQGLFKSSVKFLHLEAQVEKDHPRAVWLVTKLKRTGLRLHELIERLGH